MEEPGSTSGTAAGGAVAGPKKNEHIHKLLLQISQDLDLHPRKPYSQILPAFEPLYRLIVSEMKAFFARDPGPDHNQGPEGSQDQEEEQLSRREGEGGEAEAAPFSNTVIGLLSTLCVRLHQEAYFLEILAFDYQRMKTSLEDAPSVFRAVGMAIAAFGQDKLDSVIDLGITDGLSFYSGCTAIGLFVDGFWAHKANSRNPETACVGDGRDDYGNSSTTASSTTRLSSIEARYIHSFHRWVESQYKWALIRCSLCEDEDFAYLMQVGMILDGEILWEVVIPLMKRAVSRPGHLLSFLGVLLKAIEKNRCPRDSGLDTFRAIFYCLIEQRKSSLINHPLYNSTDSKKIVYLLCGCLNLGLFPEFDQIITHLLQEIAIIPVENFIPIVLPLLGNLLSQLLEQGLPLATPRVRLLYHQALTLFTHRYIGSRPQEPQNWTRVPITGCSCMHCTSLSPFLTDPHVWQTRIAKPYAARTHLQAQLVLENGGEDEFRFETDMSSPAHALCVTKNLVSRRYERENQAWKVRRAAALLKFAELGLGPLRVVLGDRFDDFFHLRDDARVDSSSGGEGLGQLQEDTERGVVMRRRGIVDNDDDDDYSSNDEDTDIVFLGFC